jgi:hypothetical protein
LAVADHRDLQVSVFVHGSRTLSTALRPRDEYRDMTGLKDICVDCADPWTLGHWWADVLGYRVRPHTAEDLEALRVQGIDRAEDDPVIAVDPVDGSGPTFFFNRVPEAKQAKNRVHVDVYGDADALVQQGATLLARREQWTVLADPEGNEFCVFPDLRPPA